MVPVLSNSIPQASLSGSSDCGNINCPRHGPNSRRTSINAAGTFTIPPTVTVHHADDCKDPNCPRHGQGASTSYSRNSGSTGVSAPSSKGIDNAATRKSGDGKMPIVSPGGIDVNEMSNQFLRVRLHSPAGNEGAGGTNNVLTFITNNNSTLESPYSSMIKSPSVSPSKTESISPGSAVYDKMRMEHVIKENGVLQSIVMKQNDEITQYKEYIKQMQMKFQENEQKYIELKKTNKELKKWTHEWNRQLKESEETIKNLRSRLNYTDLKAKQLKRMASENASSASKWRAKAMESLEAQKQLEEKKNASERKALGMYRQIRVEERKIENSKQVGGSTTRIDFDNTVSSAGTLDTTMIESPNSAKLVDV